MDVSEGGGIRVSQISLLLVCFVFFGRMRERERERGGGNHGKKIKGVLITFK